MVCSIQHTKSHIIQDTKITIAKANELHYHTFVDYGLESINSI